MLDAGIHVPPMFFKVLVVEIDHTPVVAAFLFPHQFERSGQLEDFLVSVDVVEAMTGLDLYSAVAGIDERSPTVAGWDRMIAE